jgi:hypothetical protein
MTNDTQSNQGPSPLQIQCGGDWLEVILVPTERGAAPVLQSVKVRILSMREFADRSFLRAMQNDGDLIEYYCKQPQGWADTIDIASQEAILRLGRELNFPTYERWLATRKESLRWAGALIQTMEAGIEQAMIPLLTAFHAWQSSLDAGSTNSISTDSPSPKSSSCSEPTPKSKPKSTTKP